MYIYNEGKIQILPLKMAMVIEIWMVRGDWKSVGEKRGKWKKISNIFNIKV